MEKAREQKVDRRVAKTQRAIHEAFQRLIVENGIDKVTVSALARAADIDRKTFYLHFASIDDLIQQEASQLVDRLIDATLSGEGEHTSERLSRRMRRMLIELAAIVDENPQMYRRLFESYSLNQMVDALYGPVRRAAVERERALAEMDGEVVDFIVRFYLSGALSVLVQRFMEGKDTPIEALFDLVERAISSDPALSAQA